MVHGAFICKNSGHIFKRMGVTTGYFYDLTKKTFPSMIPFAHEWIKLYCEWVERKSRYIFGIIRILIKNKLDTAKLQTTTDISFCSSSSCLVFNISKLFFFNFSRSLFFPVHCLFILCRLNSFEILNK